MKTRAPSLLTLLCGLLTALTACFDFSGQGNNVSFDLEGRGGGAQAQCTQDSNCPTRQICVRGACTAGCRTDSDCPSGEVCGGTDAPRCTSTLACRVDNDCAAPTPRCHPALAVCVACLNTNDCGEQSVCLLDPACETGQRPCVRDDYQCGRCTADDQCATGSCELDSGRCVECAQDEDCPGAFVCDPALRICTSCYDNSHCQQPRPACLTGPDGGVCVLCAVDADCGPGNTCNRDTLSCEGCRSDADCLGDSLLCNTISGLCFDKACAQRNPPALLELVVERSLEAPWLTAAPVAGPLRGAPGPEQPAALVIASAPPLPGDPSVRVLDGASAQRVWSAASSFGAVRGLAMGDLDGNGQAEVVLLRGGRLTALDAVGSPLWTSGSRTGHLPSLFDVDADGFAEVVAGGSLFSETGVRIWEGAAHQGGHGNLGLPGLGVAAQLDGQGPLEIIAGGTIYSAQGEVICSQGQDGYTTLVDLEGDGSPELLVVSSDGGLRALDTECALLWGPVVPSGQGQGGGPVAVADLDGDQRPELVYVARADKLVAVDDSGLILWEASLVDAHPAAAASVMDLDGDGLLEVLVSDAEGLKVLRAEDGFLLTAHPEGAAQLPLAGPVLADIDDDGAVEVVVAAGSGSEQDRLLVFGDARGRWADTRNLWNQANYLPLAVRDDLRIPVAPGDWWRQGQRAQPISVTATPAGNLALRTLPGAIDLRECPDRYTVGVGLYNRGARAMSAGVPLVVVGVERGEQLLLLESQRRLEPGEEEVLLLTFDDLIGARDVELRLARPAEDALLEPECDTADNLLLLEAVGCPEQP